MLAMRSFPSLLGTAALCASLALALPGCGSSTPDPNDPSSEGGSTKPQKPKAEGPDAPLLEEISQLNSLLSTLDKSDSGRPKALDRLGEALDATRDKPDGFVKALVTL